MSPALCSSLCLVLLNSIFLSYPVLQASTGTGREAGSTLRRSRTWASAMSNSAGQFGRQLASFVRSNTWRCTYTNQRTCFGNLEQVHNDIHNILGGTSGEMATILYAGFDPLFWLHHCQLDRALWLFQNNNGQWDGRSEYHTASSADPL